MLPYKDAYESGVEYSTYCQRVADLGDLVAEMLVDSERTLADATIDITAFTALPEPLPVLVLSEDWCGDCTDNLPILQRIAQESGKLVPRIASRDAWPQIMDEYLTRGEFRSIPVIIFLRPDWTPIGAMRERPESVTLKRRADLAQVYVDNPEFGKQGDSPALLDEETQERLYAAMIQSRDSSRDFAIQEVVRAFTEILSGASVS